MTALSPGMLTALDMLAHRGAKCQARTDRGLGWVASRTAKALEERGLAARDLRGADWSVAITPEGRKVVRDHRLAQAHPWVVVHSYGQADPIGCWTEEAAKRLPGQISAPLDGGRWRTLTREAFAAEALEQTSW